MKIIDMNKKGTIKILSNETSTCYTWKDTDDNIRKTSFNKYAFIEYLKGCNIPKKYIKQLETL